MRFPLVPEISNLFKPGISERTHNLIAFTNDKSIFQKSAFHQCITTWNSLNKETKQINVSTYTFKKLLDNWLLEERDSDFVNY